MNEEKLRFLKTELVPLLQRINPDTAPAWGKMDFQQMVEHLTASVKIASGKLVLPGTPDTARWEKNLAFLMTEKPFRENTHNPYLSEETYPLRNHTVATAISELQSALLEFFDTYEKEPGKRVQNLVFGNLDYAEQVQLLHKHALHHLRQFGQEPYTYV
jgi:hypothetical protein